MGVQVHVRLKTTTRVLDSLKLLQTYVLQDVETVHSTALAFMLSIVMMEILFRTMAVAPHAPESLALNALVQTILPTAQKSVLTCAETRLEKA